MCGVFTPDTEDDLTIHYNDVSVLENHHAYICCQLLRTVETKISCYLNKTDQRELRKIVITAILHTDMSTHDKTCQQIMNRDRLRPFRSDRVTDRQTPIEHLHTLLRSECTGAPLDLRFQMGRAVRSRAAASLVVLSCLCQSS